MARALVERGHDVTVYTSDAWDERRRVRDRERILDGVRVIAFPNLSNRLAWRRKMFFPLGLVPHLRRTATSYDVVHISAVRSILHVRVQKILRGQGVPYVVEAHGALPKPVRWRRHAAAVYDPMFLEPLLHHAGALLAQTEHEEELYRSYASQGRVHRLHLPVELPPLQSNRRKVLRERLGIREDAILLLFLGRIEERKGLRFLLDAFGEFHRQCARSTYLAIVGRDSGGLAMVRSHIRKLRLANVAKILPPIYGDARFGAYRDADAFVLTPGYWEETSLAALEACACGTPCVVTQQAEIPGLDAAGGGRTVRYEDVAAAVAALHAVTSGREVRNAMGTAAQLLIRRSFTADVVASELEAVYEAVVSESRTGRC